MPTWFTVKAKILVLLGLLSSVALADSHLPYFNKTYKGTLLLCNTVDQTKAIIQSGIDGGSEGFGVALEKLKKECAPLQTVFKIIEVVDSIYTEDTTFNIIKVTGYFPGPGGVAVPYETQYSYITVEILEDKEDGKIKYYET